MPGSGGDGDEGHVVERALVDRNGATGTEAAAGRQRGQIRGRTGYRAQPLDRRGRIERRQRRHQADGVGMPRLGEELTDRRLLDDTAGVHDVDAPACLRDDAEVVADEEDRRLEAALEVDEQAEDLRLHCHVERARRLVREQEPRLADERERDYDALREAAGQLVAVAAHAAVGLGHPDDPQQLDRLPLARLLLPDTLRLLQRLLQLVPDGQHRVQGGDRILEDHRDLAAARALQLAPARAGEVPALEDDRAARHGGLGRQGVHDRAQRQALARAALADDADRLARLDLERHAVDDGEAVAVKLEPRDEVAHLEQRHQRDSGRSASARPSPRNASPTPVRMIARPGKTGTHHASSRNGRASAMIAPHSGVGGCGPRPR